MNPWFGLTAGPCLAVAGVWILRDPEGWSRGHHGVNRAIYRAFGARYEEGLLDRITRMAVRLNGWIFLVLGLGLFIAALFDLIGDDVGTTAYRTV